MSLIYGGAEYENEIAAGNARIELRHALVGETLTIDEMMLYLIVEDVPSQLIASDQTATDFLLDADGKILCATRGNPVPVYASNAPGAYYFDGDLVCQHYLQEIHRTNVHEYQMIFYSAIKKLDQTDHYGGMYSGDEAGDILADIMGDVAYTVDEDLASVEVYGWLPYAKRRENLQMLLMAIGGHVRNASDGTLRITTLSEIPTGTIGTDRAFLGGEVIDNVPVSAVQVTEHNFLPTTEEVDLYDSTTFGTETIVFSEPMHDLAITGGTIVASGANYCTFTGAGAVTITGKRYTHVQRVVMHGTPPTSLSGSVKKVTSNTLISPSNAPDVAERLYNYLTVAQTIKQEIVFGSERPGDVVSVVHPHTGAMVDACIKRMSILVGLAELRAVCEYLVGYTPEGVIAGFENYVYKTGDFSWVVPAGVTKIRAIICGGGSGGQAGQPGHQGSLSSGGNGGSGGAGGPGGLILEVNMSVIPGETISGSCGAGGDGRGIPGAPSEPGASTTFGIYTSASGRRYPYGYVEQKTGVRIGVPGDSGLFGGAGSGIGSPGNTITYGGVTYIPGADGPSQTLAGITAYGGFGGGAAVGSNGAPGQTGQVVWNESAGGYVQVYGGGGQGADGGSGAAPSSLCGGGGGGHGGGGGGQGRGYLFGNSGGTGGQGGSGAKGYAGLVVIYY
jgi:hypothetical protein